MPAGGPVSANDLALFLGALLIQEHEGEALITLDPGLRVNLRFEPVLGPNGEHQVHAVATDMDEAVPTPPEDRPEPIPLRQRRTTPIYLPHGGVV